MMPISKKFHDNIYVALLFIIDTEYSDISTKSATFSTQLLEEIDALQNTMDSLQESINKQVEREKLVIARLSGRAEKRPEVEQVNDQVHISLKEELCQLLGHVNQLNDQLNAAKYATCPLY